MIKMIVKLNQRNLQDTSKRTILMVRILQQKNNKPPCGAPRGVDRVEADGRRTGPCPDPWRRLQPCCPPAPDDQAPPGAPALRSTEGNKIFLEKEYFL